MTNPCPTCHEPRELYGCTSQWVAEGCVVRHRGECRKPEPLPFVMTLPRAAGRNESRPPRPKT
jgi:hypothetical protein